jgi:hypothetical protein
VALGADFDGTIKAPFNASGMPLLTQGLLEAGFSEEDIAAIMGGNVLRLLLATLPLCLAAGRLFESCPLLCARDSRGVSRGGSCKDIDAHANMGLRYPRYNPYAHKGRARFGLSTTCGASSHRCDWWKLH